MTKKEIENFAKFLKQRVKNPRTRKFALNSRGLVPNILTEEEFLKVAEIYFEAYYHQDIKYWNQVEFPLIRYSARSLRELTGTSADALRSTEVINVYAVYNEWLHVNDRLKNIKKFWKKSDKFCEVFL